MKQIGKVFSYWESDRHFGPVTTDHCFKIGRALEKLVIGLKAEGFRLKKDKGGYHIFQPFDLLTHMGNVEIGRINQGGREVIVYDCLSSCIVVRDTEKLSRFVANWSKDYSEPAG